jgi:hypothetical protein
MQSSTSGPVKAWNNLSENGNILAKARAEGQKGGRGL